MLTGATLLNYREKYDTKTFFIKRVSRTMFPFLIWSVLLLFISYFKGSFHYKNWQEIVNAIFMTKLQYGDVYWFFIPLIAIYCIMPVLSLLKNNESILWYIVIFIFLTQSCIPILFKFVRLSYNSAFNFPMHGYVLFVLLGYLISNQELTKKQRYIVYTLGGLSTLFRYVITYHYSLELGKVDKIAFGYMHFHSVFLALAIFIGVREICAKFSLSAKKQALIAQISSCSLGIYLIHKIMMDVVLQLLNIEANESLFYRTIGIYITYFLCLLVVFQGKIALFLKI